MKLPCDMYETCPLRQHEQRMLNDTNLMRSKMELYCSATCEFNSFSSGNWSKSKPDEHALWFLRLNIVIEHRTTMQSVLMKFVHKRLHVASVVRFSILKIIWKSVHSRRRQTLTQQLAPVIINNNPGRCKKQHKSKHKLYAPLRKRPKNNENAVSGDSRLCMMLNLHEDNEQATEILAQHRCHEDKRNP